MRFATVREGFDGSSECSHAVGDFVGFVLCNRKLDVAEHESVVEFGGFSVVLRGFVELAHDEQYWLSVLVNCSTKQHRNDAYLAHGDNRYQDRWDCV